MQSRSEVTVIAGVGVDGDRYAAEACPPGEAITLIEEETIDAVRRDHGIDLDLGQARRNVVTAGVPLNHLVGATFRAGPVVLRGVLLARPCTHLARLNGIPRLRDALVHRGGLRADVIVGGRIRVGDPVEPVP